MKRRHSALKSRNESAKRPHRGQHLDVVDDAIDSLLQHCSATTIDDDPITQLTTALSSLDSARTSLLIARANILEKESKSADAVADALKAIECDPTSVNGYLTAGQIYANQGKQQLAVDIYEQGLRVVVPSEWPLLYDQREAAKQRLDQGVDFVAKLPAEILESIFTKVAYSYSLTLANCLQISKRWRDCLLHRCPALWRTVSIAGKRTPRNNVAGQVIRFISNQVQSLTINNLTDANLRYLLVLAENDKLPSVKQLKIQCFEIRHQDVTKYTPLINLLRDNLTKLTIMWNGSSDILATILSSCSKLEFLRLSCCSGNATLQPLQPPPLDGYHLRRLYFESYDDEPLEDLLSHCPRLEGLALIDIESNILDLADRCCPLVRHINANASDNPPDWKADDPYEDQDPPGLYTLNYDTYSTSPLQECSSILRKSKDTLRMLRLKLYDTNDDQQLQFGLSRLTKLRLRIDDGRFPTAESIIRQSPMLEDVSLNFRGSRAPDNFFMCLETHTRLRDLSLLEFDANPIALRQFFDHHASQYQSCALRDISLSQCDDGDAITDAVLNSIANITTLRRIDLAENLNSTTYEGIKAFIEQLHRLPQLETIRLEELEEITEDMIVQIAKIDGLRALYLTAMADLSSYGVRALADNASSTLQCVHVTNCSEVSGNALEYLYQKLSYDPISYE